MYNPANLNECEKEKALKRRKIADTVMTFVGIIASISSVPQALKIYETGTVEGISFATQIIALITVIAWFFYGSYIKNKPLIITTGISSLVLATVVVQMFIYG